MNPVSVSKGRDVGPRAIGQEKRRHSDAPSDCKLISLLEYLQADNKRLCQAACELAIETAALRQAMKTMENRRRTAEVKREAPPRRFRLAAAETHATETRRLVLPFGR
jgi:hypothetical protein